MAKSKNTTMALLKKNQFRLVLIAVIFLFVVAVLLLIFFKGYMGAKEKYESIIADLRAENERLSDPTALYELASKEVTVSLIESEIKDIGELATIEYLYTDVGQFEDSAKLFGKEIPFAITTKSFIAKWDGVIKAGIKVDKIDVDVNNADRKIEISLPKAEILSHEIHNESIETLDEKNGLFNPIKVDDVRNFDATSKEHMEQRAIENGLLDKALDNSKEIITKLVYTDMVEKLEYTITFEEINN